MSRYTLHDSAGALIGSADTAQALADIVDGLCAYSVDRSPEVFYPVVWWVRGTLGFIGTPARTVAAALIERRAYLSRPLIDRQT